MSKYEIFVGAGARTARGSVTAVAIAPKQPTYLINDSGQVSKLEGSRVDGQGHKKYFTNLGYVTQKSGAQYEALMQHIAVVQGRKLVEEAIARKAALMQQCLSGQKVLVVPFYEATAFSATVDTPKGYTSQVFSSDTMLTDSPLRLKDIEGKPFGMDAGFTDYWFKPDGATYPTPQVSEYGGVVERAVFVIVNSGLACFYSEDVHITMDPDSEDTDTCRGYIKLTVTDSPTATITVGINAIDEVTVIYRKGDTTIVRVNGVSGPAFNLGAVVGTIASALVLASI